MMMIPMCCSKVVSKFMSKSKESCASVFPTSWHCCSVTDSKRKSETNHLQQQGELIPDSINVTVTNSTYVEIGNEKNSRICRLSQSNRVPLKIHPCSTSPFFLVLTFIQKKELRSVPGSATSATVAFSTHCLVTCNKVNFTQSCVFSPKYRDGQPAVDVALVGDVQHVVDVSHNVRGEVGKGVRVVEHDGDGDLCGRVRCPWIHPLPPTAVPLDCDVVFCLICVELCLEFLPHMATALRLLLQGKYTTCVLNEMKTKAFSKNSALVLFYLPWCASFQTLILDPCCRSVLPRHHLDSWNSHCHNPFLIMI